MKLAKNSSVTAAFTLALVATTPVIAQTGGTAQPWVQVEATSAMLGIGGGSGEGQLTLQNLGTNCVYPFKVSGFGAGIQVGVSKIAAAGPVQNLTRLEDFPGSYNASGGQVTVIAGGGATTLKNNANPVTMTLTAQTTGLDIGFSGQGLTINMPVPPVDAPRQLVLEFGYNKDWLNKEDKGKIDQFLAAWKCRFGQIEIVGHTDSVGKEDANLKLSVNRATAVRDYVLGAGVWPTRIEPLAAGENNQQVTTYQSVRLRANRVVVVTIK
jgi:outer membrane protein OmpA-like peptidoglycan-associated protein